MPSGTHHGDSSSRRRRNVQRGCRRGTRRRPTRIGVEQALVVASLDREVQHRLADQRGGTRVARTRCAHDTCSSPCLDSPRRRAPRAPPWTSVRRAPRRRVRAWAGSASHTPSATLPIVGTVSQPLARAPRAVRKLRLDELAEAAADLILALRDDRRVRNREAQRVAEQRRHGEPVGECADHRRLGDGADVSHPRARVLVDFGDHEHDCCDHQERGGHQFHTAQHADARHVGEQHGRAGGMGQRREASSPTNVPSGDPTGSRWPTRRYARRLGPPGPNGEVPERPNGMPC